jgi:hypothetical protein
VPFVRHPDPNNLRFDEAGLRKCVRFRDQMLAATETNFEPNDVNRRIEQLGEVGSIRVADVERKRDHSCLRSFCLL